MYCSGLSVRSANRPQFNFKIPVDNRASVPFKPNIKHKPHALQPLCLTAEYDTDGSIEGYEHPYKMELNEFRPPAIQLARGDVIPSLDIKHTPLQFVQTTHELNDLLHDLMNCREFAVDLEHHSYRSFQGITCLMQISTRQKDYIVDTLALRDELHTLNEVFVNPQILKVFHGADWDIEWLQRDLSLYVVNMFDTHQAGRVLFFPKLSLASLLQRYCNIEADKSLAVADWRKRPLRPKLIEYARQDTHYLLFIYDKLRQELLEQANHQATDLLDVYQRSTMVCQKRYNKFKLLPTSHLVVYNKSGMTLDERQLRLLRELYAWRDRIARKLDEGCGYVLPNRSMLRIIAVLPTSKRGILACCDSVSPIVIQNVDELRRIVVKVLQPSGDKVTAFQFRTYVQS